MYGKSLGLELVNGQAGVWIRELGRAGRCMERARARLVSVQVSGQVDVWVRREE